MQEHLYGHFSSPGHNGVLNDESDPKKQEDYWMKTLKTMLPYDLDIEDSV